MTQCCVGIELGSTRIKAVLIDQTGAVVATGSHAWANRLVDGHWTYSLDEVWFGVRQAYAALNAKAQAALGAPITQLRAIGVSAMMHGYLAFGADDQLLTPFRTWRDTTTGVAADALSEALDFAIPQRWSIAHLWQAILDEEPHVGEVAYLTTLAGYVHWRLTGRKVLGIGDASGMFPIDSQTRDWDQARLATVQAMIQQRGLSWRLEDILPTVLVAGQSGGTLTAEGAALLDPSGVLATGALMAPPEGDAGTGMVATNSVAPRTGNVSVGTSIFAMVVLERPLARRHPEIDLVTTPAGDAVAMVHCNNGASEIEAWATLFAQFARQIGVDLDNDAIYAALFAAASEGPKDGGGWLAYNYLAGEPITGLEQGRPLVVRAPDSTADLTALWRTLLMSAFGTLALGMRILREEKVEVDSMFAHGGIFATKGVAQKALAAALDTAVGVGETASEGGAWGMAVLADFAARAEPSRLSHYLDVEVFAQAPVVAVPADPRDVQGFQVFLDRFEAGLGIERAAVAAM
ncbi:MAG: ATPase [Propionibacteriaceae bacterium]|jgi:sugar (pentulose or hexulose) kinase|nr:ATPase [Propionibacteriaceae bacterium]